jgi:hypothetical protein
MLGSIANLIKSSSGFANKSMNKIYGFQTKLLNIDKSIAKPLPTLALNLTWCKRKDSLLFIGFNMFIFVFARFGKVPRKASKVFGKRNS